jgi:FKBP-type peptidyl-prolyl cis-trans isomerase FkpA
MWRAVAAVALVLGGGSTIPFGVWVIAKSRLPSWMTGFWKWPLGENLSPEVAYWQGWAGVLVGAAALVTLVPLLNGPDWSAATRAGLALAVLFLLVGIVAYVRSIVLSHRAPGTAAGVVPAIAMRSETALAVGLVAGLVLGALLTASVSDAFPVKPRNIKQTTPLPLAEGLLWNDVQLGSGPTATAGKVVKIQYTIWLGDGTRIDSSADHGNSFTFTLGKGQVIKGFDDGLVGMRVGGIRWLTIPPALAYGAAGEIPPAGGGPSIPPNSTLVCVITLLSVSP